MKVNVIGLCLSTPHTGCIRCCGDNSIVTYVNATFYPKQVADVTTGTATTAQTLYNPVPKCGGCCNS